MLIINDEDSLQRALDSPLADAAKTLLRLRADQLRGYEGYRIADLARWIIVQPGDSYQAIETTLAFPIFTDGMPNWEWVERHGDHFEAPFILTDEGYGHVLLVPDRPDVDAGLLNLLRDYAI